MSSDLTASVIIPTYNRPEHIRLCLSHLESQTVTPELVVVVDASPGDETATLVSNEFPDVRYLRNHKGAGSTATSRSLGLAVVVSDVVAFLDDDAYAEPGWLANLLMPYRDPAVGAVGGRALNGVPGEEREGNGQIGMLLPNGTLTGNFAADPGRIIKVDHMLGANMSFRKVAIEGIGGIRDVYPGTCLREETDPALRVRAAGWILLFNPASVVRHVAGAYAKGKRFDRRYVYYGHRNHVVLLASTLGPSPELLRYLQFGLFEALLEVRRAVRSARSSPDPESRLSRAVAGGALRAGAVASGMIAGLSVSALYGIKERTSRPIGASP